MEYQNMRLADYTEEAQDGERGSFDAPFLLLTMLLLTIGVIMVLSASFARAYYDIANETDGNATYYFMKQLIFAALGIVVMFFCSRFPMSFYRQISFTVLLVSVGLLVLVLIIGTKVNDARRWINLGFTTIQPSEIAKISIILFFSTLICKFKDKMATIKYGLAPFATIWAVIVGLLILEPHFSGAVIIITIGAVMLFLGGVRLKWFLIGGGAVAGLAAVVFSVFDYTSKRISAWLDPFSDMSDTGYQIVQSLFSVGSGGLTGLGLGQGRQKYLYLPEEHNDYIFSVICEELGFIGAILILLLFALLIIRGYWLALHARDRYSFLVCAGITTLLAVQVILNIAVVTNLLPATGISLPFFSYGGTALLIQMAETGIILSMSRDIPQKKQDYRTED
ncbi:MAG: putative lipid II flippase FtsW [Oscillospiraceae bacterium]|nr:putative lipid II flippase FtsW [Oscillospiraceae bacterium]